MHQRVEAEYRSVETERTQVLHAQDRRVAADQRIADLWHVEGAPDALELIDTARCLDENAVGAGAHIALGAAQRLVEVVNGARIGAGEDPGLRVAALRTRRLDLCLRNLGGDDLLADHVAAAFGPLLIFDQDRAHAHALVALNGVHDVLHVAVTVVAVDEHRQVAGRHDVAHRSRDFADPLETDIGHAVAGAGYRKAADEVGLEADRLNEPRAERVMGAGDDQEPLVLDGPVDDLTKTRAHDAAPGFADVRRNGG